jgi:hypothetical protein
MQRRGCSTAIWKIHVEQLHLLPDQLRELDGVELLLAAVLADGVERGLEEVAVVDARDLDRVLEGEEQAFGGALLGIHLQQVLAVEGDTPLDHLVGLASGEHRGKRALAGAVRPHDGVHLARLHRERDAPQDVLVFDARVQVVDLEHDSGFSSRV